MAIVEMVLPPMGESVFEATVNSWLKQVGENIQQDESLVEVATDKVDTDVPASHTGVLQEILIQEGEVAQIGQPIALINTDGDAPAKNESTAAQATPVAEPMAEDNTSEAGGEIEMVLPPMGESVFEATVNNWLKAEGDTIEADESIVEVATDKVDTEVPASASGVLTKILVQEGELAKIGSPIALIKTADGNMTVVTSSTKSETITEKQAEAINGQDAPVQATASRTTLAANGERFYSPLVRSIIAKENISTQELTQVNGTGLEGRVTKKDIMAYLQNRGQAKPVSQAAPVAKAVAPSAPASNSAPLVKASPMANDEIVEMDRMRKMIADRMVDSKRQAPHVTSFVESDVTEVVNWRNANKNPFQQRYKEKLTFTPIFVQAIVKAIQDYPAINASVDGDRIIMRKDINIGIAVALPSGNLIVPVIKNADKLSLAGLAEKVNDLAKRARENKLTPDDLSGGTYTVSNIGSFGNIAGTPIIMQPQVAIMALGSIQKKPAVVETPQGDFIGIRQKMILSHSYDHRVVDGQLGGLFVKRVSEYLEAWNKDVHI
ncbi:2-oxoglutarate dehydrogenase, E2 component, dihydrolipoamide succinyltransferase [Persicobacter diffluens]|uniref:Dihydrolipoamide acetyltransferase component of pyruvate dehydrogenase complex n=1 Tax=Persicobacter diffluens TaxID=981 RepID=A0AAN4VXS0_9BACT|nr:dihydrolipoamide acetyltransferase component of pyruvate dehydrogenase complex [Persicobacter diffluens]